MRWARTAADYEEANAILNHPAVLPYHFLDGMTVQALDLTGHRVAIEDGKACWLFVPEVFGFEVHTSVLPEFRNESLALTKYARDFVFVTTTAERITSYAPSSNKSAIWLAKAAGMKERERAGDIHYFVITREEWEQL